MSVKRSPWSQHPGHPLKYNLLVLLTEMIPFYFKETTFFSLLYMRCKLLLHLVIVKKKKKVIKKQQQPDIVDGAAFFFFF